jgi:hypothetical protein
MVLMCQGLSVAREGEVNFAMSERIIDCSLKEVRGEDKNEGRQGITLSNTTLKSRPRTPLRSTEERPKEKRHLIQDIHLALNPM